MKDNRYFCSMIRREIFKGVNSIKFYNRFKNDDDCLRYMSEIKWPDESFVCQRCGNTTYHKGRTPYSRRCNKCKRDESVTSGTMLDRMKLAPVYAFHIAFKIATKKKGMSSMELAEEYELRQKTVWEFKWKLQQAMKSSGRHPLTGTVHVDEFYIGGEEAGVVGRSSESAKKLVIVALEIVTDSVGRAYAQVIEDASSLSFRPFFEKYISKDAKVVTDEWKGYLPLKDKYQIEQRKSENGTSFPQMHIHIMNIKGWLRGIHHHCTKERLQGYLDEYHFRFNRRNNMDSIFDILIRRLMNNAPTRLASID